MFRLAIKRKMKRRIPIIRLKFKNGATYDHIQKTPEIQDLIHEELLTAIRNGIKRNFSKITLLQIGYSDYSLELDRSQWKKSLKHIQNKYISEERYIECAKIRDLIKQL